MRRGLALAAFLLALHARAADVRVESDAKTAAPTPVPAVPTALSAPALNVAAPGIGVLPETPVLQTESAAAPAVAALPTAPALAGAVPALPAAAVPAAQAPSESSASPSFAVRVRAFLRKIADPFASRKAAADEGPGAPKVDPESPQGLDQGFQRRDFWAEVAPDARAEIEGLRAQRLSKAALKDYVRVEVLAAFERIKAARGVSNIGLHYNLHGGVRENYVGAGIRASKGDIALRYTPSGDMNDKVYFFQTAGHHPYDALDASNGEMLFLPSRMGSVLSVFDLDAPELKAAMADGRITNVGSISMDFHKGMRGVPYSAFLAPPVQVFVGTGKKLGLRRVSRDEETLATARLLEAAVTSGGAYVPGSKPADPAASEKAAQARALAAASASPSDRIQWRFKLVDGGYLYHGTTLDDLVRVVESGGAMAPQVSQYSMRANDSVGYASERQRKLGRADNPMVLLQFRFDDLASLVGNEQFRPALSVTDRGMPPMHAAYVAAEKPVPLSLMTPESKKSILLWLRAQAARRPGEPRWRELLPRFERALGA